MDIKFTDDSYEKNIREPEIDLNELKKNCEEVKDVSQDDTIRRCD